MRSRLAIIVSLLFAFANTYAISQTARGESAIRGRDAVAAVAALSEKKYAGRLSRQPGYTNATKWSLSRLKRMGLKGELQPYPQPHSVIDGGSLEVTLPEGKLNAEMLAEFMPLTFGDLQPNFLTAMISYSFSDKLMAHKGTTTEALQRQLRETKRPASMPIDSVIGLSVRVRYFPHMTL